MRRGKSPSPDGCLLTLVCCIGFIVFLIVEHPVFFWLILVPCVVVGIANFVIWLKNNFR